MKIACVQLETAEGLTKEQLLQRAERQLREIGDSGESPDLVIFPELWGTGFFHFDRYAEDAEPLEGTTCSLMRRWAEQLNCWVHTGSFVEEEGGHYYNTSLLLDPRGEIRGRYRKIHLFSYQSREPEILTPGEEIVTVDTPWGKVGMAACYDLRFPELFRAMSREGAEMFLVTSGWPRARIDHWNLFTRARAVENQAYMIACNGAGAHGGAVLGGGSIVVEPEGEVVLQGSEEGQTLTCGIDTGRVKAYREHFSALKDRRLPG